MQEALKLSTEAGYKDYEVESIKGTEKYLLDPIFWHFLGISQGWRDQEWKMRRKQYFEWCDQGLDRDLYFEKVLNRKFVPVRFEEIISVK